MTPPADAWFARHRETAQMAHDETAEPDVPAVPNREQVRSPAESADRSNVALYLYDQLNWMAYLLAEEPFTEEDRLECLEIIGTLRGVLPRVRDLQYGAGSV